MSFNDTFFELTTLSRRSPAEGRGGAKLKSEYDRSAALVDTKRSGGSATLEETKQQDY